MVLCSNREEGFGPRSILASPLPTTCFTDTIINPLPVFIYLFLLPLAIILSPRLIPKYRSHTAIARATPRPSIFLRIVRIAYYVVIVLNILMQTLEIVRLSLEDFGVALLPFNYVGLILGLVVHATNGYRGRIPASFWVGLNVFLWLGMMIVSLVKVGGLVKMESRGIYRTDSKYPMSDWVIDVSVIAGVYLALFILELCLRRWHRKGMVRRKDEVDVGSLEK